MQATGESGGRPKRTRHRSTPREAAVKAQAREQAGRKKAQERVRANERNPVAAPDQYRYTPQHELPADPARRAAMLERVKRYRAVTGRNLLKQDDMGKAYRRAGLMWDAPYGATDAFRGSVTPSYEPDRRPRTAESRAPIDYPTRANVAPAPIVTPFGIIDTGARPDEPFVQTHSGGTPWWRQSGSTIARLAGDATESAGRDIGDLLPVWIARQAAARAGLGDAPTTNPVAPSGGMTISGKRRFDEALEDVTAVGVPLARRVAGLKNLPIRLDPQRLAIANAYASGDEQVLSDYEDLKKRGVLGDLYSPEERSRIREAAYANGWDKDEVDALDDYELTTRAMRVRERGVSGAVRRTTAGLLNDLATQTALMPGVKAGVEATLSSPSGGPQFAWDTLVQPYIDLARDPSGYAQDHPLYTATMVSGAAKGSTGAFSKLPGARRMIAPGRRVVVPRALGADAAEIDLGGKTRNVVGRPFQIARERALAGETLHPRPRPLTNPRLIALSKRLAEREQAKQAVEAGTRAQLGAENAVMGRRDVRRVAEIRQQIPEDVRIVLTNADNFGRSWRDEVAAKRKMRDDALAKDDPDAAARHAALADQLEQMGPAFDKWMTQRHQYVEPGSHRRQWVTGAEIAEKYREAWRDLTPEAGQAFSDFTGDEPRNMAEQTATRHFERVAGEVADERAQIRSAIETAQTERGKARGPVLDEARTAEREARDAERVALQESVAIKTESVRKARARLVETGRALRKAMRTHEVEVARQARQQSGRTRNLRHISVDTDGSPRGAKRLAITTSERVAGVDSRFQLRPGLIVERVAQEGEKQRTDSRGLEGAIRGYAFDYRLRVGSDGLVLETMTPDGVFAPETFNTMRDAVAFARRLDGVHLDRPWEQVRDAKADRVLVGDDEAATLRRRANDLDPLLDSEEAATIQTRLDDLESGAADKTRRAMRKALDEHAAAIDALGSEVRKARPEADWTATSRAARLRSEAAAKRDLVSGALPRTELAARDGATPAEAAYVDAANQVIRHRAARHERLAARRDAAVQQIAAENPDSGFAYVPDITGTKVRGLVPGTVSSSLNMTERQALRGSEKENRGINYRKGVTPYQDVTFDAAVRSLYTREFARDFLSSMAQHVVRPEKGARYSLDEFIPIQWGGERNVLGKDMTRGMSLLAAIEDIAKRAGVDVSDGTASSLMEASLAYSGDASPVMIEGKQFKVTGPDVMLLPKHVADGWMADRKLRKKLSENPGAMVRLASAQRRIMLRTLPGTAIRNIVGSIWFALASGASPIDFAIHAKDRRARRRAYRTGEEYVPGRGTLRPEESRRGVTTGDLSRSSKGRRYAQASVPIPFTERRFKALYPVAAWADLMGNASRVAEDMGQAVTAIHNRRMKALDASEARAWDRVLERMGRTTDAYNAMMDHMQTAPASDPLVRDVAREVSKWHGDMLAVNRFDRGLSSVIAFHKWYEHIVKQTLVTLPFKHPLRGHILQQLAQQGEDYVKRHGILPDWMADSWIVKTMVLPDLEGKAKQLATVSIVTQGDTPWGTAGGLVRTSSSGDAVPATAVNAILPAWNAAATALLGDTPSNVALYYTGNAGRPRDRYGNEISGSPFSDLGTRSRILANMIMRMNPMVNAAFPSVGLSADALPWEQDSLRYRSASGPTGSGSAGMRAKYAPYAVDAEGNDWALRREYYPLAPRDVPGLGGQAGEFVLRAMGMTPRVSMVGGPISDFQRERGIDFMVVGAAAAKKKRENRKGPQ